jgi:hypothetical protein
MRRSFKFQRLGPSIIMMVLAGAACAHSNEAQVTVMRSGPIYPSSPDNCSVSFLNHPHLDILASGYEVLATLIFSGTYSEMDRAAPAGSAPATKAPGGPDSAHQQI